MPFRTGFGLGTVGIPASFKTGFGLGTVGMPFRTGSGLGTVGIPASGKFGVGETKDENAEFATGCVVGAATALTADRARAEPRATHETFNHERIWIFLNWRAETCSKTN